MSQKLSNSLFTISNKFIECFSQFLSLEQIEHNRIVLFQELNQAHLADLLKEQIEIVYAK